MSGAIQADGAGEVAFPIPGLDLTEDLDLFMQMFAQDPTQPQGYAISNTLRVRWPDERTRHHVVAVRGERYKLIRVLEDDAKSELVYGPRGTELLFDLHMDPFESTDLLTGPGLTPEEAAAYAAMSAWLGDLDPTP